MEQTDREQSISINEADIGEAADLLGVQKRAFLLEAERYNAYSIPPLTETVDEVREAFGTSTFLKAELDGRIVGVVRATRQDGSCLIGRLAVEPDLHDKGIGTALLKEAESRCGDAPRVELFVGSKSYKNIHIYEKMGYRTYRSEDIRDDVKLLYMEKRRH